MLHTSQVPHDDLYHETSALYWAMRKHTAAGCRASVGSLPSFADVRFPYWCSCLFLHLITQSAGLISAVFAVSLPGYGVGCHKHDGACCEPLWCTCPRPRFLLSWLHLYISLNLDITSELGPSTNIKSTHCIPTVLCSWNVWICSIDSCETLLLARCLQLLINPELLTCQGMLACLWIGALLWRASSSVPLLWQESHSMVWY